MNTVAIFACLLAVVCAKPSGDGHGVVISGPSGVVTNHGAIGPAGSSSDYDDGHYDDGSYNDGGHWDGDGAWGGAGGAWGGHGNVVVGHGATLLGAGLGHAVVAGPVPAVSYGWGVGHGGAGAWGAGHGGAGVWGVGHGGAGAWGGHGHGPYSNVVHGNGAVSVGAAGPIRNDLGHGHGVAVVGPATATVKIVGPGATGKIVASGLWGPTHAHGHGYGHGHGHW